MVVVNIVNRLNNYSLIVLIEIAKEQLFSLFTISAGTLDPDKKINGFSVF